MKGDSQRRVSNTPVAANLSGLSLPFQRCLGPGMSWRKNIVDSRSIDSGILKNVMYWQLDTKIRLIIQDTRVNGHYKPISFNYLGNNPLKDLIPPQNGDLTGIIKDRRVVLGKLWIPLQNL